MGIYKTLSQDFLHVVDEAAIACARTMGQGDRHRSDQVAVEAMRKAMDRLRMRGTVVIGEGERDEAPMLFIGEKVGAWHDTDPEVDIAVDPLEGTNLCATGAPNAIAVLAASNRAQIRPANPTSIALPTVVATPRAGASPGGDVSSLSSSTRARNPSMSLVERSIRRLAPCAAKCCRNWRRTAPPPLSK